MLTLYFLQYKLKICIKYAKIKIIFIKYGGINMLEAYSTNIAVTANSNVPFNSTSLIKGKTVTKPSADTINLNKCGVYMVTCDVSAEATTTIQLVKNGVPQPQAQSTGGSPSFTTLVQVSENNTCCACTSPTTLQITNSEATTLTDANIVVTKLV